MYKIDPYKIDLKANLITIIVFVYGFINLIIYGVMSIGINLKKPCLLIPGLMHHLLECNAIVYIYISLSSVSIFARVLAVSFWEIVCLWTWYKMLLHWHEVKKTTDKCRDNDNKLYFVYS